MTIARPRADELFPTAIVLMVIVPPRTEVKADFHLCNLRPLFHKSSAAEKAFVNPGTRRRLIAVFSVRGFAHPIFLSPNF